jgi:site-specific DNA-cytosine methylase
MKKEHLAVISEQLGVEPVFINSALVSAQNRQRYYWANWQIKQPADLGIVLADIIECGDVDREKAHCLDANYFKGGNLKSYFDKNRRQLVFNPAAMVGRKLDENGKRNDNLDAKAVQCLEVHEHGKARCVSTVAKDSLVSNLPAGRYPESKLYRKLTTIECERLQTVPDNYTAHVSNTQRYKMLGNGWTVDVIAHILRGLK